MRTTASVGGGLRTKERSERDRLVRVLSSCAVVIVEKIHLGALLVTWIGRERREIGDEALEDDAEERANLNKFFKKN